jgi:hypothetical protein
MVGLSLWSILSGISAIILWQADHVGAVSPAPAGDRQTGMPDDAMEDLLRTSRALSLGGPQADLLLAAYLERRADAARAATGELGPWTRDLVEARGLYETSVAKRPSWPIGYLGVLRTRLKEGDLGRGFDTLYRRAAGLGLYEPAAQRGLFDIGLIASPAMDDPGRSAVALVAAAALDQQPRYVLERAAALATMRVPARLLDLPSTGPAGDGPSP